MRPRPGSDPIVFTTNMVIRNLARRVKLLNAEMRTIDQTLTELISETAPSLLDLHGIGTDTAAGASWLLPVTIQTVFTANGHGPTYAESHPSQHRQAK